MSCPHSNSPSSSPQTCSQCLAYDARQVTVEEGVLLVDGTPLGKLSDVNKQKYAAETSAIGPPNKARKCSLCNQNGHNARTCGVHDPRFN